MVISDEIEKMQYKRELFIKMLLMFRAGAMQQLGVIDNPVSGQKEIKLDIARETIDMIDMLAEKTEGNLIEQEKELLDSLLTELHLLYVKIEEQEKKEPEQ